MKRWIPLLVLVVIGLAAPAAFAGDCAACVSPTWCDYSQPYGAAACIFYHDPSWCEEVGWCPGSGAAPRSFSADWKVASVTVLTPEGDKLFLAKAKANAPVAVAAKGARGRLTQR
jgi:hypothetical protein